MIINLAAALGVEAEELTEIAKAERVLSLLRT